MRRLLCLFSGLIWLLAGCGGGEPVVLAVHHLDDLEGLVDRDDGLAVDADDRFEGQ